MLISCHWLAELLGGEPLDPTKVEHALTAVGLEVEGSVSHDLPGVIVGELRSKEAHPKADRLTVCEVSDGEQAHQVVCGASNLPDVGGKVAFAPVGCRLPGGLEIGAREIRGVASAGMICSETELEIGADDSGILVLPSKWPTGAALMERIPGAQDTVIEIGVTPNRPDALGHVGVARDLAIALERPFTPPEPQFLELPNLPALVELEDAQRCGRYLAATFEGVRVRPSPPWLRLRLHRVGLRAINNVVDVTNYVLMEYGQPLHAFDRAKLAEGRIVVRRAKEGETMTALDGSELELSADDLVIADAERAQALAGVMGGAGSDVDDESTELLLEVAWFEPRAIRRSARRHQMATDSSYRFERGVDHDTGLQGARARAMQMLVELCGARASAASFAEGQRPTRKTIPLRPSRIESLLGVKVESDDAASILERLGIEVDRSEEDKWECVAPTHRPDLELEEDLVEEVMRHRGLDDLPARACIASTESAVLEPRASLVDRLTDALAAQGLHEHLSMAFCEEGHLERLGGQAPPERRVRLRNPMRSSQAVMRTHMLPGLLEAAALNVGAHSREVRLFEVGRVYDWPEARTPGSGPTAKVDATLPRERTRASAFMVGRRAGLARAATRTLLEAVAAVGEPARAGAGSTTMPWLHPGVQTGVWVTREGAAVQVGVVGELHPDLALAFGIESPDLAVYGELWGEALDAGARPMHGEVPRFPASSRDLSLEIPVEIDAASVVSVLEQTGDAAVGEVNQDGVRLAAGDLDPPERVAVIEDYRGEGIDEGRRALLLRLSYRAHARSVTDGEVQTLHDEIVKTSLETLVSQGIGARVR